jgi:hypothetical protein
VFERGDKVELVEDFTSDQGIVIKKNSVANYVCDSIMPGLSIVSFLGKQFYVETKNLKKSNARKR